MTSFESDRMVLQLEFESTPYISEDGNFKDMLYLTFFNVDGYKAANSEHRVNYETKIWKFIPKQTNAEFLLRAEHIGQIIAVAGGIVMLSSSVVLNTLFTASLNLLWSAVNIQ